VILDEAHNLKIQKEKEKVILKCIIKALKVLLLTATPCVNEEYDIVPLISMVSNQPIYTKICSSIF
jgi:hypothetical protein